MTTTAEARLDGLDDTEVRERIARGQRNAVPHRSSRSRRDIVRANVLTRFNAILGALFVVIVVVGPFQDALFGFVLVGNTLVGVVQELRARRTLDRLALLAAPRARAVRNGAVVDESLLTGEPDPVAKAPGDEVLSGSFVAAGSGRCRAVRVGPDAFAVALADQARRFTRVRSELRSGIDSILRLVSWALVPVAVLLVVSQLRSHHDLREALRVSVAGVGSMVPEGLVLLTSVAFAVGAVRLARRHVLVQELPAIEGLARVDVVCIDKTGTLTQGSIVLERVDVLDASVAAEAALGAVAAADPNPNPSLMALRGALAAPGWAATATVPFSSARKWSAAAFGGHGSWVLGAPDVLLDRVAEPGATRRAVERMAAEGRRVMLLAHAPRLGDDVLAGDALPDGLRPAAMVVLQECVRPDAADTLAYFAAQGVRVKVLSGDHPATVGAVASRLGLRGGAAPVDAREMAGLGPDELADAMEAADVFGRVTPHQKRDMVAAMQSRGHVVAMTGDGVNDVLALKDADLGVAMGAGSAATRAVAQLVLLDNSFSVLPAVVAEGRRAIANIERVANLFVTKTVYAFLLAVGVGVAFLPFPFYPRHLTVVSSLTIGIPAFFLALAPNATRARPGFVRRVLRFTVPAGVAAAGATLTAYAVAGSRPGVELAEQRTTAMIVLFSVGIWVLVILTRPFTPPRRAMVTTMAAAFVIVLAVGSLREFFALRLPPASVVLGALAFAAVADAALEVGWRVAGPHRPDAVQP